MAQLTATKPLPRAPAPTLEQRLAVRARPVDRQPTMYQSWEQLLFLHWAVDPGLITATLPEGLTVDTFDGAAYLAIIPFYMRRIRPRGLPALPVLSNFLEINVRTYVYDREGVPGVWFYGLDTHRLPAVLIARLFFHLPYYWAKMSARRTSDGTIDFRARRRAAAGPFAGRYAYRPVGDPAPASPGTLPFFLAERYMFFTMTRRGLARGHVHHTPYPLQAVETPTWSSVQLGLAGFSVPESPPDHTLYSAGVDVDTFALQR